MISNKYNFYEIVYVLVATVELLTRACFPNAVNYPGDNVSSSKFRKIKIIRIRLPDNILSGRVGSNSVTVGWREIALIISVHMPRVYLRSDPLPPETPGV